MRPDFLTTRWQHTEPGEVVVLDNRDSFVFNLAHRFAELGTEVTIARSDEVSLEDLVSWEPAALVVSPGPGHPEQAGGSVGAVRRFSGAIPILGICLGHQAIVCAFGGGVEPGGVPMHGKPSQISHDGSGLLVGLPRPFVAARYHSLVACEPLPDVLEATAQADGFVMGVRHCTHPTFGVQIHPESVLTPHGYVILGNFLRRIG